MFLLVAMRSRIFQLLIVACPATCTGSASKLARGLCYPMWCPSQYTSQGTWLRDGLGSVHWVV